jgi:hypothetical protein
VGEERGRGGVSEGIHLKIIEMIEGDLCISKSNVHKTLIFDRLAIRSN